ncbi:MAG: nucleotidyltransferase family protein [Promethearchaeota archaeon]|nr:MAG: nucleotidyltransferase family protein [Candidatus Lokiarchaeota archaeon]
MKAIVLCAGLGKRLKPYTKIYQKSMLPIHGKPLLEYILNGLMYADFKDLIIVVGYKKEQIIDYFKNGEQWNINLEYIEQRDLNGTGGALLECQNAIENEHFLLTWGDILVPYKVYKEVFNIYNKEQNDFILVTNYMEDPYLGGAVYVKNNYCLDIIEKPPKNKSKSNLNNCGIFILSKEIFEVLYSLVPSKRGEIELTEALRIGIHNRKWKIRVIKMEKNQFRGDFGNKKTYEQLKVNSSWLRELDGNNGN